MFEKERESLRRQGKWVWFLIVPLLCVGSYCVCGIGAAVAIPGFVEYTRRSKAEEARANLATLAASMEAWCDDGGAIAPRGFPASVGPIPAEPREERQTFVAEGSFVELGFAPDPVYYTYAIETVASDHSTLIAAGDLDGDGVRSRYVVSCRVTSGRCECDPQPTVEDALE